MAKMNSNLSPLFSAQLKILSKSIIKKFQAELTHELKTGSGARDFKDVVSSQMQSAQKEFEDGVKCLLFYHVAVEKKATKLTFMFMAPLISDITS
jgi:hypothetical protein